MALFNNKRTVTFDEVYNAWTSFHSYTPEWIERLGTVMYTFKNGQMYEHDASEARGNFYGTNYGCDITFSSNEGPSDIKVFKALSLETNSNKWFASINSELESGVIGSNNQFKFVDKEGMKYAYIRRNSSDELDFSKLSVLGIGLVKAVSSNEYSFTDNIPNQVSANGSDGIGGDKLYYNDGSVNRLIGVVLSKEGNTITVVSTTNIPAINSYCFIVKDSQSESYGVRGYHSKIKLSNNTTDFVELFASNAEVFKSFM